LPKALFEADLVLNLPKFKTHSLTYITGAVKNLFGFIHGLAKSRWHVRAPSRETFSGFLLDLYEALLNGFEHPKPFIHVMDAVLAMEGEGPGRKGRPKKVGAMILGEDALAVDALAVELVGLDPRKVPMLLLGRERGLGETLLERCKLTHLNPGDFEIKGFQPSSSANRFDLGHWPTNTSFFKNLFIERPIPSEQRCTLCYRCMAICPAEAIERAANGEAVPRYDYGKCIRCYCCMEICPEGAVLLKRGRLQWVFGRS